MSESPALTDLDRHSLFEACTHEAKRLGGDERTAEYFFVRAQTSRVWLSSRGNVTVADMDIQDWCSAIAWSAPGMGRKPQRAGPVAVTQNAEPERKQARSGAGFRRSS